MFNRSREKCTHPFKVVHFLWHLPMVPANWPWPRPLRENLLKSVIYRVKFFLHGLYPIIFSFFGLCKFFQASYTSISPGDMSEIIPRAVDETNKYNILAEEKCYKNFWKLIIYNLKTQHPIRLDLLLNIYGDSMKMYQ